jgi:hypothetical protein
MNIRTKVLGVGLLIIFVQCLVLISPSFAYRDLPGNTLAYPVLIILENGSTGSGFYRKKAGGMYLATAKHVLFKYPHRVRTNNLPSHFTIPPLLKNKLYYLPDARELILDGKMTDAEKERLLGVLPNSVSFKNAVEALYYISRQPLRLRATKAILISYRPNIEERPPNVLEIDLDTLHVNHKVVYHPSSDVAAVRMGKIERGTHESDVGELWAKNLTETVPHTVSVDDMGFKKFDQVHVSNEVFMFGYPTSLSGLIPEIDIKLPLLRKGIVAGKNLEKEAIIIDCPAFFGNSGGLVVEIERFRSGEVRTLAIGIISKLIPYQERWAENSGYTVVVPMDRLEELISNEAPYGS